MGLDAIITICLTIQPCECRWFQNHIPHCISYWVPVGFGNIVVPSSLFQGPHTYVVGIGSSFLYHSISISIWL